LKVSLVDEVLQALTHSESKVIANPKFGKTHENELLLFLKPECFVNTSGEKQRRLIHMIVEKTKSFKAEISGVILLTGGSLASLGIMDRHYGYINRLSRNASRMLTDEDRARIETQLRIEGGHRYLVLGGHEVLDNYRNFDAESLDDFWLTKKSFKLRGGFYFQKYEINKTDVVIINGFHPAQLNHYTDESHRILLFVLHSNSDWHGLRKDFVGDTFPERAVSNSVRGELHANGASYGITNVSISYNGVHLSAGPFEGFFEIDNFFKDLSDIEYSRALTNVAHKMAIQGLTETNLDKVLSNPTIRMSGKEIDLFSYTEDKDTSVAVQDYARDFKG